jgi:CRISPR/Cas system-associated exonuclease Cas4 (RecB family)
MHPVVQSGLIAATSAASRRRFPFPGKASGGAMNVRIFQSPSAGARLHAARRFLDSFDPATDVLLVGATRGAVDEFARAVAAGRRATFGLQRFSFSQLAARVASLDLAAAGLVPASRLGAEAVALRASFEALSQRELEYFEPVARLRGFSATLASTLADLRLHQIDPASLDPHGSAARDLRHLADRFAGALERAGIADRATIFTAAARAVREGRSAIHVTCPILLLDVPVEPGVERALVAALAEASPQMFATVPEGDDRTRDALAGLAGASETKQRPDEERPRVPDALARLRRGLFAIDVEVPAAGAEARQPAEAVSLFSAPGEGREAVEIARRILREAARGVPFDEMAILVRAPHVYAGLLETALRRARVPAWFARGTAVPDPSGRAFLALLACAADRLSARRFSEYLSLGQVPDADARGAPPEGRGRWVAARSEETPLAAPAAAVAEGQLSLFDVMAPPAVESPAPDPEAPVIDGTLHAPWHWDRLLVESAVIGGGERWARRLSGLAHQFRLRRAELQKEEPGSAALARVDRDLRDLEHLRRFALPVIDALARLPDRARWGEWIRALERLAPMVLRHPDHVLEVLAELRPMEGVGPVTLDEVQRVLTDRLTELHRDPPSRRYGAVFVGQPEQVRGATFRVVFVPGLAERLFPQKPRQDPLLLDDVRPRIGADLPTLDARSAQERLRLRLAAGAAGERLYLSYPRMEVTESRPRVPSFYALDVDRAITGRVPDLGDLEDAAYRAAEARLAWPAPQDPTLAIDDTEHDLAVLGRYVQRPVTPEMKGRARYLLDLNPALARALRARYARWSDKRWSAYDGLYKVTGAAREVLERHRLTARPYSVSGLQKFAVCPYQFLLSVIHRLEPREEIEALEKLDPLTKGRLFHRVQADFARAMKKARRLPVTAATLRDAWTLLDRTLDTVAAQYYEDLAPAIDRVWRDEIESMRADLRGWLQRVAETDTDWVPAHAEFGFGFGPGEGRDPHSLPDPVRLGPGWLLHGIVDLIEAPAAHPGEGELRVTDHKTGKNRTEDRMIVGHGEVLQPVLYGLAIEAALARRIHSARLSFCTAVGNFSERQVRLDASERRHGLEVLAVIDRAIEQGTLLPAPRERACNWCDFREVCGPWEEKRSGKKDRKPLADLDYLRGLP